MTKQEATKMKTRILEGYEITLETGQRYIASRPILHLISSQHKKIFPVTIRELNDTSFRAGREVLIIGGLDYNQANALLRAFNNGPTSFDGRVW